MPKIIENVREQLLAVARKQTRERGYAGMTIRSVASECGLAVGTVYNYFKSKDMLIASFMIEDWDATMRGINERGVKDARELLFGLYTALKSFAGDYDFLFSDSEAARVFAYSRERHGVLRHQLAEMLLPVCESEEDREFRAVFAAESLIFWTMSGEEFDKIAGAILKVISR